MTDDGMIAEANILSATGAFDASRDTTELRLDDGRVLRIPTVTLVEVNTGSPKQFAVTEDDNRPQYVIPVMQETLTVNKRSVETGVVRVQKTVQEYSETLDEPLAVRTFDVERVILNRPVDVAPEIRHEGETTIYSLVEEQLVLTKQLVLREELHVTRRDTEKRDTQAVMLRREHVVVERTSVHQSE